MRYLKNYELENMGKPEYKPNNNFQEELKYVYDNLSKEEFDTLLYNCKLQLIKLIKEKLIIQDKESKELVEFKDSLHQLAFNVFSTVYKSRKNFIQTI